MLNDFQEHINDRFPFFKDKKILIAISGGIDSVVLAHLFSRLDFSIQLAHCNFRLRGKDANADEQFVKKLAKQLKVEYHSKQFNTEKFAATNKLSIQMAARKLRYDWFDKLLRENKLDYIVTAHHLDDSLETFLINFTRGTGLSGLTGIPEINGKIIRPLLAFSRERIEIFAKENQIKWRDDATNVETKYTRNKIRHQIIPLLKEINPSLLDSFKETTKHLAQSQQIIDDVVLKIKSEIVIPITAETYKIDIQKIKKLSNPKAYLYELLKTFGFTEWNDVYSLLDAQSGKQLFSETHRLLKDRDHFLLEPLSLREIKGSYLINEHQEIIITDTFSIRLIEVKNQNVTSKTQNLILVDKDTLEFPLELRKWQKGDYFYPLGMTRKKKLSKFFKDEKYSLIDKENTWLLCSQQNIFWVVGKRLDTRFKVTENTKKLLQIEVDMA